MASKNSLKSTIPVDHNFANPSFNRVKFIVERSEAMREIAVQIQRAKRDGMDFGAIKAMVAAGDMRAKLRSFYSDFDRVEDTPPVMAMPPSSDEVYGRIVRGTRVVDVGSGNCGKLVKHTGHLKITSVDPNLQLPDGMHGIKGAIQDNMHLMTDDVVVTSNMALCQLPGDVQRDILDRDGVHLVPDHNMLLDVGAARECGDKLVVRAPAGDYVDERVDVDGFSICPGYILAVGFTERKIDITLDPTISFADREHWAVVETSPVAYEDINLNDVSMKMDGTAYELECHEGVAYMVDRAGKQRIGTCTDRRHMVLQVEELSRCYTLIRILVYAGFVPPHCGVTLRRFANRVAVTINGKPLLAPPSWSMGKPLVEGRGYGFDEGFDGLITRVDEKDFYTKFRWTFDFHQHDVETFKERASSLGMGVECDAQDGLWEYGVDRIGGVVTMQPLRLRTDKDKATTMETALMLLNLKTVPELCELH